MQLLRGQIASGVHEMRSFRRNCRGQVLILAALAIALIISSTMVYVFQLAQATGSSRTFSSEDYFRIVQLGSRNLVIGSLAEISHGGSTEALETNLERWRSFVEDQYYLGECHLSFALYETPPYASGVRIFWGADGFGVTSAKVDFSMNLTDESAEVSLSYSVNVTTSLSISGMIIDPYLPGLQKVQMTIYVYNEGEYALANNFTVYYYSGGIWNDAGLLPSYILEDYGDGKYVASFDMGLQSQVDISVQCYDLRDIFVSANATCT